MAVSPYKIESRWYCHHLESNLDAIDSILDDAEASKIESRHLDLILHALASCKIESG
jgi:hypothetical protein